MKRKKIYTIKYVADHTGLKPHVIRAWESRYQAVAPKRTPSNRRLYCQEDLRRLKLLKTACEAGHQISRVANVDTDELLQILKSERPGTMRVDIPSSFQGDGGRSAETYRKQGLQAVLSLDPETLERTLCQAAVHLPRQAVVESVIVPLFERIGELWKTGRLKILNERIASNCIGNVLWDMLRSLEIGPRAPNIVLGTPAGQHHELGALSAALAAAEAGWRPIYVGANLPAEELAAAVSQFNAKCIGLSVSIVLDESRIMPELIQLRRYIGGDCALIVGGLNHSKWNSRLTSVNALPVNSWRDLMRFLS
jgi:DNA-binding transcriptional MerR regulator/methylmalonyl-CoA mutase cobalamin-binding subunit